MSLSVERTLGQATYPKSLTAPQTVRRPAALATTAPTPARPALICPEVAVLFTICMADALSSAFLFHFGLASEANPLLRSAAEAGTVPFLLVKCATFVPALLASEWWRRQRPTLVPKILRVVIAAYVTIFATAVAGQFLS